MLAPIDGCLKIYLKINSAFCDPTHFMVFFPLFLPIAVFNRQTGKGVVAIETCYTQMLRGICLQLYVYLLQWK